MAKRKRVPQGQINNKAVFNRLNTLMKDLSQNISIRVGIIGSEAYQKHPHSDLTMAELGAIHEFGALINHPGGTPYEIKDGKAVFVKKNEGAKLPRTQPHQIVIPTRSFLRMPLLSSEGKRAINKLINEYLSKDREYNILAASQNGQMLRMLAELVAIKALQRVQEAFQTMGFGNWPIVTPFTLSRRRSNQNPNPLEDSGDLMDSITAVVKGKDFTQELR